MDNNKLELFAEVLDIDESDLSPDVELKSLDEWDSIAVLSFIAMMGEKFGKVIDGDEVRKLNTVADALAIMES